MKSREALIPRLLGEDETSYRDRVRRARIAEQDEIVESMRMKSQEKRQLRELAREIAKIIVQQAREGRSR